MVSRSSPRQCLPSLIFIGVAAGLVIGKPVGILAFCWLADKLGICEIPREIGYRGLLVVGTVAGIGFTMAIFIAELAFADAGQLAIAKTAVLTGSLVAAAVGLLLAIAFFPRKAGGR